MHRELSVSDGGVVEHFGSRGRRTGVVTCVDGFCGESVVLIYCSYDSLASPIFVVFMRELCFYCKLDTAPNLYYPLWLLFPLLRLRLLARSTSQSPIPSPSPPRTPSSFSLCLLTTPSRYVFLSNAHVH